MAEARQLFVQHLREIGFGDQASFKIQPRRVAQIAMRGPDLAIAAAILRTTVGVEAQMKRQIRRAVAAERRLALLPLQLGTPRRGAAVTILWHDLAPAIIKSQARIACKSVSDLTGRATPLDGNHRPDYIIACGCVLLVEWWLTLHEITV